MASWIPSSIQKRLLRYALNRSGLLDVTGIDLDNLDISWGRRSTLEFKNVGLNVEYLSGLAHLPPNLRLESARILLLRLTIPADLLNSSISVLLDGVEIAARLVEEEDTTSVGAARVFGSAQSPSHRKTTRRIHSPPPTRHGESRLPTAEDLAKSFLAEEPPEERQELEASVAANSKPMDESIFSESSDGSDVGTGAAPGLPGFLSHWLQRLVDRFELTTRGVHVSLDVESSFENFDAAPTSVIAKLDSLDLLAVSDGSTKREVKLGNFSIELVADTQLLSSLSHVSSPASPTTSRVTKSSRQSDSARASSQSNTASDQHYPMSSNDLLSRSINEGVEEHTAAFMQFNTSSLGDIADEGQSQSFTQEADIQMGEDNISWTSRRSRGDGPTDDPWNQPTEDDLPDSLLLRMNHPLPQSRSSAASSSPSRSRRPMPPYDRGFQSPGSWPRAEESPQRSRIHQGPGSWPALDQSQHSMFQSVVAAAADESPDLAENIQNPLDTSLDELRRSQHVSSPAHSVEEKDVPGLEQSRYFSHEEAKSIYMSAVVDNDQNQMPGAWESDVASSVAPEESAKLEGIPQFDEDPSNSQVSSIEPETPETHDDSNVHSEAATPRAGTPSLSNTSGVQYVPPDDRKSTLQLLFVDTVSIFVSQSASATVEAPAAPASPSMIASQAGTRSLSMSRPDIPGAFSVYSQISSSQRRGEASSTIGRDVPAAQPPTALPSNNVAPALEIQVGTIKLQADLSTVQVLYKLSSVLPGAPEGDNKAQNKEGKQEMHLSISVERFHASLHQQIEHRLDLKHEGTIDVGLLNLSIHRIRVDKAPSQQSIRLGILQFDVGGMTVLSFDQDLPALAESMIFEDDLRLSIDTSKHTNMDRPISNMDLKSRPIRIEVDLSALDIVFNDFGGISGVLDIGSSIASNASPSNSPAIPDRSQRVRFEDDAQATATSTEYKVNASIAGLTTVLAADSTAVVLQSSPIKAVYREKAASVRFSHSLRLSGPYRDGSNHAPVHIDVAGLWVYYFFTPQEPDLERLLALITPSKDKYDNDDDILIETLLRQRRKGACLRVNIDDVRAKLDDMACLHSLHALGTQFSRLSAVTKYLPEDERPGLLSLVRVKQVEARVPVNERFGIMRVAFRELQCAHVGLPALLALSLSNISMGRAGGPELVHALVPLTGGDDLPMVMARVLGDEVEPVAKIKLYNVCVEYSVATLLDLTGKGPDSDAEEIITELATSVADLALGRQEEDRDQSEVARSERKLRLHLLLHNSAVGLTPQKSPSKGLFILTDARLSTIVPACDPMDVNLDLRQAGILITDDALASRSELQAPRRNPPESTVVDARVLNMLWKEGYASVGSIMSAVINTRVKEGVQGGQDSIEVDIRNDFFLLETCADSTQTLTAILGGLAPPTPPSKQPKYLTEPITLDDMISSLSGDAYAQPERPIETLFDAEDPQDPESDFADDPDGMLMDADMSESLYGPVSGLMGDLDADQQTDAGYGETVESLLEDDPFEMTNSPDDMPFSDSALLRDLRQQAMPVKHPEPVDLENYEIEDLGFDALGVEEKALGTKHRFSAPTSRRNVESNGAFKKQLPFKLRLRDVNATWHMHDGYDWQKTRDGITAAVEHVEQRAEERLARRRQTRVEPEDEESTIGDCMFNSVYITVPNNITEAPDIRRGINRQIDDFASETESMPVSGMSRPTTYSAGGRPIRPTTRRRLKLERSRYHKISFELKGVSVDINALPPDSGELQSSVDIRLKQFEIFDNVPTSTWKKFLTQKHQDGTQEIDRPMVHIELLNKKTIQERDATDLMIHVAIQPLRLHVDQDALDFITRFTEFKDSSADPPSPSDQPFLSRVEVDTVDLQLDYKPKKVDYVGLRSGHTNEFMNFVILDAAPIRLRHAIVYGIRGFEPLHKTLNDVWMPDVKRNQLPTILSALAPVRSLANLGSGVRDVVAIPIREYRRDGRVVRSVRKGAFHFGQTTASELARLGAKVAIGTQTLLAGAEGLLASPSPPAVAPGEDDDAEPRAFSAYADQPLGVFAGLRSARRFLEHDLLTARDALIAVQGEVLESAGPGAAARAVARHAPTVVLRPVIGASRAVGTTLLGVGNQIDRGGVRRMEDVSIRLPFVSVSGLAPFWTSC